MLDGIVCLVVIISALIGMKKGIGDTVIRLLGLAGGLVIAVLYGKDFSAFLLSTPFKQTLYGRVFDIMRPEQDSISKTLPGTIGNIADEAANKAAAAVAERVTESLMGIIAFVGIVIAVWLAAFILRAVFKKGRKSSILIGGADSLLGLALGTIRGIIIVCLLVAALMPATALFAPQKVSEMLSAAGDSYLTKLIYDVNPLLTVLKSLIRL